MLFRTLVIASTMVFIAGCESELESCIDANMSVQRLKIINEKLDNDSDAFETANRNREPIISDEDQEKAERKAIQFCNLHGIY
jgi:hypothetical protein